MTEQYRPAPSNLKPTTHSGSNAGGLRHEMPFSRDEDFEGPFSLDVANPPTQSDSQSSRDELIKLAEQLHALASELAGTQSDERSDLAHDPVNPELLKVDLATRRNDVVTLVGKAERTSFLALAKTRYESRRMRASVFKGQELFGEPAWDILLDLYIAYAEGKPVSVSSACIGSASPPTTGLRWLGVLQEAGLIEREHDPRDQRRVLVHLTTLAIERMEAYFRDTLAMEAAPLRDHLRFD